MANPPLSEDEVSRQILGIFMRHKVAASVLRRNHFFDVRDGDFQRGINRAVHHKWITRHMRYRYRYILTDAGSGAGCVSEATKSEIWSPTPGRPRASVAENCSQALRSDVIAPAQPAAG
jgi:hypothetical protein